MKYYKNCYTWLPVDAIKFRELTVSMNRENLPYYISRVTKSAQKSGSIRDRIFSLIVRICGNSWPR